MPTHWWAEKNKSIQYAIWLKAMIHDLNSPLGSVHSLPLPLFIFQRASECMGDGAWHRGEGASGLVLVLRSCLLEGVPFFSWLPWLLLASGAVCGWWTCGPVTSVVHDIVFSVCQLGNCSASCLLSSPAPRNRQESHTVTVLFTQLLLKAGSLKVEYQHTFISYSHSHNLREI